MPNTVSVPVLAEEKGVTSWAVHLAIRRGVLEKVSDRPILVSRESAEKWEPDRVKQESGRVAKSYATTKA